MNAPSTSSPRRVAPQRRTTAFVRVYAVLLVLALAAFVFLAVLATTHAILPFDVTVTRAIQSVHVPLYRWILTNESDLGYTPLSPLTFVVIFIALYALGQRLDAVLAILSALLAGLLGGGVKILTARPRPSPTLVHVTARLHDFSFPSGHVIHYTTLFGFAFCALLMGRRRSPARDLTLALLALIIILVGPSRVYLGEHWPTDVLGGYLLGGLWLAGTIEVRRALLRRRGQSQARPVTSAQPLHRDVDPDHDPKGVGAEELRAKHDA